MALIFLFVFHSSVHSHCRALLWLPFLEGLVGLLFLPQAAAPVSLYFFLFLLFFKLMANF